MFSLDILFLNYSDMKKVIFVFAMLFYCSAWNNLMAQYEGARRIDLENMVDRGDTLAWYYLGLDYLRGHYESTWTGSSYQSSYTGIDETKGIECLQKSADTGNVSAMLLLGRYYDSRKLYEEAIKWLDKSEENEYLMCKKYSDVYEEYAETKYAIGVIYRDRETVQDFSMARKYFEQAVNIKGDKTSATCDLGLLYERGQGVQQDFQKAKEWYEKAVMKGSVVAKRLLGNLYLMGNGVEKDYQKAYELFNEAFDNGDNESRALIAKMYYYGYYVEKSPSKAFGILLEMVNSDNLFSAEAMRLLSACYRYGYGTDIDNVEAEYWLQQAALFNSYAAKNILDLEEVDKLANQGMYIIDGINYEFASPDTEQINNWKKKYQRLCFKKIKDFPLVDLYGIPEDIIKAEPCLVYLLLVSKSIEGYKKKKEWIALIPKMTSEQMDRFYDILYREAYGLAEIEYKYKNRKAEIKSKY